MPTKTSEKTVDSTCFGGSTSSLTPEMQDGDPNQDLEEKVSAKQNEAGTSNSRPELLVGDLVWAKIPGHPWWPSMVSYEPSKAVYFQSSSKHKKTFKYHVQFFGDVPLRGWVSEKMMLKFKGRQEYMSLSDSVIPKREKIPQSKQFGSWDRAIDQAEKGMPLNRQQRKLCFCFKYEDKKEKEKLKRANDSSRCVSDQGTKKKLKQNKKSNSASSSPSSSVNEFTKIIPLEERNVNKQPPDLSPSGLYEKPARNTNENDSFRNIAQSSLDTVINDIDKLPELEVAFKALGRKKRKSNIASQDGQKKSPKKTKSPPKPKQKNETSQSQSDFPLLYDMLGTQERKLSTIKKGRTIKVKSHKKSGSPRKDDNSELSKKQLKSTKKNSSSASPNNKRSGSEMSPRVSPKRRKSDNVEDRLKEGKSPQAKCPKSPTTKSTKSPKIKSSRSPECRLPGNRESKSSKSPNHKSSKSPQNKTLHAKSLEIKTDNNCETPSETTLQSFERDNLPITSKERDSDSSGEDLFVPLKSTEIHHLIVANSADQVCIPATQGEGARLLSISSSNSSCEYTSIEYKTVLKEDTKIVITPMKKINKHWSTAKVNDDEMKGKEEPLKKSVKKKLLASDTEQTRNTKAIAKVSVKKEKGTRKSKAKIKKEGVKKIPKTKTGKNVKGKTNFKSKKVVKKSKSAPENKSKKKKMDQEINEPSQKAVGLWVDDTMNSCDETAQETTDQQANDVASVCHKTIENPKKKVSRPEKVVNQALEYDSEETKATELKADSKPKRKRGRPSKKVAEAENVDSVVTFSSVENDRITVSHNDIPNENLQRTNVVPAPEPTECGTPKDTEQKILNNAELSQSLTTSTLLQEMSTAELPPPNKKKSKRKSESPKKISVFTTLENHSSDDQTSGKTENHTEEKVYDTSPTVTKRSRKRKTMSDFHTGKEIDEILKKKRKPCPSLSLPQIIMNEDQRSLGNDTKTDKSKHEEKPDLDKKSNNENASLKDLIKEALDYLQFVQDMEKHNRSPKKSVLGKKSTSPKKSTSSKKSSSARKSTLTKKPASPTKSASSNHLLDKEMKIKKSALKQETILEGFKRDKDLKKPVKSTPASQPKRKNKKSSSVLLLESTATSEQSKQTVDIETKTKHSKKGKGPNAKLELISSETGDNDLKDFVLDKASSQDKKLPVSGQESKTKSTKKSKTMASKYKAEEGNMVAPPLVIKEEPEKADSVSSDQNNNAMDDASTSGKDSADETGKPRKENVCLICEQPENLMLCSGVCMNAFHPDCLGLSAAPQGKFTCDECLTTNHACFACAETGNLRRCGQALCGKFYHEQCALRFPSARIENGRLLCSLHYCRICSSEKKGIQLRGKLLRCIRCPTAYHINTCFVAGCLQLTNQLMVCEKHFVPDKNKKHHTHTNVSWCFICSSGGMLVCCESCPAAFHPECVDLKGVPDGAWQCEGCRSGSNKPLYGDIVWVKFGFWRWWPAIICYPEEVPVRIQRLSHQVGEFPVMFFGSRDYCWLHSGRVFGYQEGDKGSKNSEKNHTNRVFQKALQEAAEAYRDLKEMETKQAEQRLQKQSKKPPPYKHIKSNKCVTAIRNNLDPSEWPLCECSYDALNPCGPLSECLNRMLQFECNPKTCRAKERCQNQQFQKCQYSACSPYRTDKCGWGLRADKDIKKGEFVIEYGGELIDVSTCRKRIKEYHDEGISDYYFLVIDKDCIIDAYPKGNQSRFMNHSCDPNCDTQKWTVNGEVRVGLIANDDIRTGSELTFQIPEDIRKGEFVIEYCGELIDDSTCRKRIKEYHDEGISDYYFLVIDKDCIIDAYPKGNQSRFMNHSCDPNCDTQKWTVNGEVRVGLFANDDIRAGSELTFNYNLDCLGNEKKECKCNSTNCSGFLGVRPKTQMAMTEAERKKKAAERRKQRRKEKKEKEKKFPKIRHEDECFKCGDGGELIMCDKKGCAKCYHVDCLSMKTKPRGRWDCPWHFCDECGKKATELCRLCPNSYCITHAEGHMMELTEGMLICDEHASEELKSFNQAKNSTDDTSSMVSTDDSMYKDGGSVAATESEDTASEVAGSSDLKVHVNQDIC